MATLTYTVPTIKKDSGCFVKREDGQIVFLRIEQDAYPTNPRIDFDGNLSHLICWHRRYNLGDEHEFASLNELNEELVLQRRCGNEYFSTPLYLLDHSGLSISTQPFANKWDSGLVGVAYIFKKDLVANGIISKDEDVWRKKALEIINEELELYNQYLEGDVYGYTELEYSNGAWFESSSCWGFFGDNPEKNGMLDEIGGGRVLDIKNEKELMKYWKEL